MSTMEIQKKIKFINDANGKNTDVIVPFELFKELLELKISMEIYEQENVKQSLKRAKKEVNEGKAVSFKNMDKALQWLKQ